MSGVPCRQEASSVSMPPTHPDQTGGSMSTGTLHRAHPHVCGVCASDFVHVYLKVCVCSRAREKERESVGVCVRAPSSPTSMCVCVRVRERKRESVCVCVFVCVHPRVRTTCWFSSGTTNTSAVIVTLDML